LLAITLALTMASEPSPSLPGVAATMVAGVILLAGFAMVEIRKGKDALMPVALFSTRPFIGLSLLTLFLYAALGGLVVLLPYFLIEVCDYSAVAAGAAMLPLPVAIGIGSPFVGMLSTRFGTRTLLGAGSGIVAVGLTAFTRVGGPDANYLTVIFPAMFIVSMGMMLCVAPLTTAVIEAVDSDHVGAASGLNSAVARVGGLLATASLGSVFVRLESADTYLAAFHTAVLCGAALASASAVSVLLMAADAPPSDSGS
jgi:predicted MFS family arabinose efflux permease